jgi:hypothetical protein
MPTSVYEQLLELKSFATAVMSSAGTKIDESVLAPCTELDEGEVRAPKTSLKGWRMAVNDCIEMSSHWSTARVIAMDAALRKAGIVTLSEIRRRYSTRLAAVLKRGSIRGEVEYYLAAGLVADTASNLSAEERLRLQVLVTQYEQSAA